MCIRDSFKAQLAQKYADIVYNGQWFTPLREALDAFADSLEKNVTGDVKLKLYKLSLIHIWSIRYPAVGGEEERRAYVYLPTMYEADPDRRYPVLYMFCLLYTSMKK